jgi:hypothetical protein
MKRLTLRLAFGFILLSTVALIATGTLGWAAALGGAAAVLIGARAFRCSHPGPLGLLPPTTAGDGTRTPAQWFCDSCGKTWPAVFEREQRPIRRFEGYDASKAAEAARRADDLYKRQQAMAMRRAGLATRRTRAERPQADVVPIEPLRRAK